MHRVLVVLFWIFAVCYVLALAVFAVGMFGAEKEPLSGIFLIPLGFPWFIFADLFTGPAQAITAALSPLVNLAIIRWLANRFRQRADSPGEI